MKRSITIFIIMTILSVGALVYGSVFVYSQIGEATLTEETLTGDEGAAEGLTVGSRADATDKFHWINSFDYSTGESASSFKRGEMTKDADTIVYDDMRFTGWSVVPYYTRLEYGDLEGIQEKGIQDLYDEIQHRVSKTGTTEKGKIKLSDHLDYYPISFRFQFGTRIYNSDNALKDLKVYDEQGGPSSDEARPYDETISMYAAFNDFFKIPVIEDEYQEYEVSKTEDAGDDTSLGHSTEVDKPLGKGEDLYQFDPIIVVQEENIMDGKDWYHPDLERDDDGTDDEGSVDDGSDGKKMASHYDLKNRMLFVVNNRTAKGRPVDVSQISGGYGVYELPIETTATATIGKSPRSWTVSDPKPLTDQLKMTFPLDEDAEYVEMSLSGDHRYLAVFSVKDGSYSIEMIDADHWTSDGPLEVFPASGNMTYAWGEDGSLAMTDHEGHVAVVYRTDDGKGYYDLLYSGKVSSGLDEALFDTKTVHKKNSRARYSYGVDSGLAVTVSQGKTALVQNTLVGDPEDDIRNAALECVVIDRSGVIYRGRLENDIVDLGYDMSEEELNSVRALFDGTAKGDPDAVEKIISPVRDENWAEW